MSHSPLHLTARDFDAYAPEKATSNAFSRPRMDVKQRALAWARGVAARLANVGVRMEVDGSDEHPTLRNKKRVDSQWVFLSRDAGGRAELERVLEHGRSIAQAIDDPSPWRRHALLLLRIHHAGADVSFAIHPEARVDVDNARARCSDAEGAEEVAAVIRALPEEFAVALGDWASAGPQGGPQTPLDTSPSHTMTAERLLSLVARLAAGEGPLRVGWSVRREVFPDGERAQDGEPGRGSPNPSEEGRDGGSPSPSNAEGEALGPSVDEQLEDALVALAPLYAALAWSHDNDRIALARRIEDAAAERARVHAEAEARTEQWAAAQAEARRRVANQFTPPVGDAASNPAPRRVAAESAPKPGKLASSSPPAAPTPATPVAPVSSGETRAAPPSTATFERGSKVRVRTGPFADKTGLIGELDGRGGARVLFGLLSTRMDLAGLELIVDRGERPALPTSHRRAPAPAPRRAR